MKVRCEYCQNAVEAGGDRICPYCGSPLPAPPEPPGAATAPRARGPVLLLVPLLLVTALLLLPRLGGGREGASGERAGNSIATALEAVNAGSADGEAYRAVIAHYLEAGQTDDAYAAARDLAERPDGGAHMDWCVRQFSTFGRQDLAARLAVAADALSGDRALLPQVSDTPLSRLLPDSPLCQAMELVLGRTADAVTLADLQAVTGLSIGRRDSLSGAQEIGVAFDGAGEAFTYVTVEAPDAKSGLGTICFQGLRRLVLNDSNVQTRDDLFLPGLLELSIPLRMDAKDLTKFTHLKKLERLQIGGPSLVSLEGLEQLPGLTELSLFDTGLTDLSALAARRQITALELLDNDRLTSVASLSQATHLQSLSLAGKALTDLSPLRSLSGLERLAVAKTAIRDTSFLLGMAGLKELTLTENKELDAVPELTSLPALERLTLDSDGAFAGREALAGLGGLRALKLRSDKNISFLQPLQGLEELTVYSYQSVWDVSDLSQFRQLKRLSFSSGSDFYDGYTVALEGLDGLRGLPLEELDLHGKEIYGPIDPILEIKTLRSLNLNGASSQGTDYQKFANLQQLQELDLGGYRDMVDTPPGPYEEYWSYQAAPAETFVGRLGALAALERLSLAGCGVEDAGGLRPLPSLQYLDLAGNNLTDISPLAGLTALRYLNLSGNRIADYSPVEGRAGLTLIR